MSDENTDWFSNNSNKLWSQLKKLSSNQSVRIVFVMLWLLAISFVLWSRAGSFSEFFVWVLALLFIAILCLIVWHFTKSLPGIESPTETASKADAGGVSVDPWLTPECARIKRYWMMLAYCFMILALIGAVFPFTIDLVKDPEDSQWLVEHHARLDSPIGVFRGCSIDPASSGTPLHCGGDAALAPGSQKEPWLSWIIQVGGYVTPIINPDSNVAREELERKIAASRDNLKAKQEIEHLIEPSSSPEQLREKVNKITTDAAEKEQVVRDAKLKLEQLEGGSAPADTTSAATRTEQIESARKHLEEAKAAAKSANAAAESLLKAIDETKQLKPMLSKARQWVKQARSDLHWLVYARDRQARGDSGYYVEGGLIIPFYLIVLSLIGGAVSLTRRIPEYQKQSVPGYVGTEKAPALSPAMLREFLIFQIVQFISAPIIAAVAYYVLEPTTTATTVGLAFAAGFASETVLLWVRAVVDKLRPEGMPDEPKGSLTGSISSLTAMAKTAEETEKGVKVGIIGHGELMPVYAANGQFAINGIPEGQHALEVALADDKGACIQRVSIQAGKTLPVWIECPFPGGPPKGV